MNRTMCAAFAVVALGLGGLACGGSDSSGSGQAAGSSGKEESTAPTEIDLRIARLVESRGADLDLTATQFFSDVDFDAVRQIGVGALEFVAPTRLRIAKKMQKDAAEAADALAKLAPDASTASEVAARGEKALAALEGCAKEAATFWAGVIDGGASFGTLRGADGSCERARAAFAAAEAAIENLPEASTDISTGGKVSAGDEARVVVGVLDPSDPQAHEVVQPVSQGSKVAIVLDAKNTSAFEWRLNNGCDGPLTFEVTLVLNTEGTVAIDPAEAGYRGSDTPSRKLEATIKGQERFELDVGTFTVADDASGPTRVLISLANNRCPDPETGSLYSPIATGAGSSELLVLEVEE